MSGFANAQGTTLPGLEADRILQHGYDMDAPMAPPPSIPSQLPLNLEISTAKRHRKPKAPTKSKDEWEAHRPHIHRLYVDESLPLAAVMKAMGETYGFHASRIQYGSKINEWGFQKKIRGNHMRAIARKKISRQSGDSNKASTFRLRKQPVPEQKIDRYIRSNALDEDTIFSDAPTPSDISCETPGSLTIRSPSAVSTPLDDTSTEKPSDDSISASSEHMLSKEIILSRIATGRCEAKLHIDGLWKLRLDGLIIETETATKTALNLPIFRVPGDVLEDKHLKTIQALRRTMSELWQENNRNTQMAAMEAFCRVNHATPVPTFLQNLAHQNHMTLNQVLINRCKCISCSWLCRTIGLCSLELWLFVFECAQIFQDFCSVDGFLSSSTLKSFVNKLCASWLWTVNDWKRLNECLRYFIESIQDQHGPRLLQITYDHLKQLLDEIIRRFAENGWQTDSKARH